MNAVSVTFPRWKPLVSLLMLLATASGLAAQTPPRDSRLPAQPQTPTRDRPPVKTTGTAVVKGRVVDGVSGSAIARARVRLTGTPTPRASVLTDGEGAFAFTGLPTGAYAVMADKSTYMTGAYPDPARTLRSRMVQNVVTDGQVVEVTIKLFHGGAITGRVVDAYGDPLEWADVRAMFIPRGRPLTMRTSAQTNDLGEFRLSRLQPGRYILSVTPRNTSSDEPFNARGGVQTQAQPSPQPTPTYYPGAASPDEAQALVINRGATISGIEIVLGEGIPTIVTGVVMGPDGPLTSPNGNISVRYALSGTGGGNTFVAGTGLGNDGSFRLQIHPGQYILDARVSPPPAAGESYQPGREMMGTVPLTVGAGGVESVTIVVGKPATATGRVIFEGTTPPPAAPVGRPQYVPISGEEGGTCRVGQAAVAEDWTFKIDNLVGTCGSSTNTFGRWMLKSVRIGGVNALEKPVTFEPGRQYTNVEIVVSDKPSQIELTVAGDDGQPTREYAALAFPVDKSTWKRGPQVARTLVPRTTPLITPPGATSPPTAGNRPDGQPRDVINGLRPGEYYVITIDDIDAEDAYDPTVWEKLSPHATRVTLGMEGIVEVSLQRMKAADLLR